MVLKMLVKVLDKHFSARFLKYKTLEKIKEC